MIRRLLELSLFLTTLFPSLSHAAPEISTPAGVSFGNTLVQNVADQTLTIQNTGNKTLMVNSIELSGSGTFSLPSPPALPIAVEHGASIDVTVRFATTTRGPQSGTIAIGSNDPVTPTKNVALSGTGVAPAIHPVPFSLLNFGNVAVPSTTDMTLSIHNNGDPGVDLVLNSISISGSGTLTLQSVPTLPAVIAPFGWIDVTVRFTPTSFGPVSGLIEIESSDPFTPTKGVDITGTAVGPVIASDPPQLFDFGNFQDFATAEVQVFARNDAPVETNLLISGASITGPDSSSFNLCAGMLGLPWVLPRASSVGIHVCFNPRVHTGPKIATLNILSNDPVTPVKTIDLRGTGIQLVDASAAASFELALRGPLPNPASGSARFDFTLPEPGTATLSIFDVHGRHVATLAKGAQSAGPQSVRWDGADDAGRRVPGGVYFARLVAARKTIAVRFALVH